MRLIDADALIAEWCDGCKYLSNGICDQDICGGVLLMKEAPTIDVENFVRYHMDEISRTIRWQLVKVDTKKPYCPKCGAKMEKDGDA